MVFRSLRALLSVHRLAQFSTVGIVGFGVDLTVLALLVEVGGWRPILAKIVAAEAAILVMFGCNERWTFSAYGGTNIRARLRRLFRSNVVRFGGVSVAVTVLYLLHNQLGFWYIIANVIGIGCGFIVNYTFESLYTWRIQRTAIT